MYAKLGTILTIITVSAGSLYAYNYKTPEERIIESIRIQNEAIEEANDAKVESYRTILENCQRSATGSSREILEKLDACKNIQKPELQMIINYSGSIERVSERTGSVEEKNNLRKLFGLEDCRFVNDNHKLQKYNLEWLAYDIACEKGKSFDVKSPGEYTIEKIGYGTNLGNYIILRSDTNPDSRIVLGHIDTPLDIGANIKKGTFIGQTNLSGASTGIHIHIELWENTSIVDREYLLGEKYQSTDQTALLNHRNWDFGQKKNTYYFTSYNLGDVKQNDASPCIGASGRDLCDLEKKGIRTMALTSDIRSNIGVKFGDRVQLLGEKGCEGTYQVEDEMNIRFRKTPGVLRPNTPFYIKGDIPSKEGGVCSIIKL